MYPVGAPPDRELQDQWNWEFFTQAAEKCAKGGHPFGMPLSTCSDAVQWVGAMFNGHGVQLVDANGQITVNSDATRAALEWFKRTAPFFPESVYAWDDASNNKALISGQSALIFNAPSAWAVAKRDQPKIAEQLWTFPPPKGPKGRHVSGRYRYWGIWNFSPNKAAAKSLLLHLSGKASVEKLIAASQGFDVPPFDEHGRYQASGRRPLRPRVRFTISRRAAMSSCRLPAIRPRRGSGSRCTPRASCAR